MSKKSPLTILSRQSPLALVQARWVQTQLRQYHGVDSIIQGHLTQGDKQSTLSLSAGRKDSFVKDLQQKLLNGEADLAVHSLKDMLAIPTPGLTISAFCERADPRDVFISHQTQLLSKLPMGARIGTSSPRRTAQLNTAYPHLRVEPLRGNVGTRLHKLDQNLYDGIILAAAGLLRLGLAHRITSYLSPDQFVPAAGQGVIAIECREDDATIQTLTSVLNHAPTQYCVTAERALNRGIGGNCDTPLGAYAYLEKDTIILHAVLGTLDHKHLVRASLQGTPKESEDLGFRMAETLLNQLKENFTADS